MSWRDQYQPGNFRGATFVTQNHEATGGRRLVVHQIPGAEEDVTEDLGRSTRSFRLDLFVIGEDYYAERDALIAALETKGAGTLVHPWLGQKLVSVDDGGYSLSESTEEGGMARFSVRFVEAGRTKAVAQTTDASLLSIDAADTVVGGAAKSFSSRYAIAGFPSFVEQAASRTVAALALWTQLKAGIGGGTGPALRAFEAGLSLLGVSSLIRSPFQLGNALVGLVQAVSGLGGTSRRRISALSAMIAYDPAAEIIIGATSVGNGASGQRPPVYTVATAPTPTRRQEAANRDALLHVFRVTAAAELVRTIANSSFASQDEAQAVKTSAVDLLDDLAIASADIGEDERAEEYQTLRRTISRDVAMRAPQLPRLREIEPRAAEPAIVISNRLYGHELAEERAEDIVARNAIAHPAFVPDGKPLKVIANG